MSYYRTCPHCGAHLDPGEVCDCTVARYLRLTPENRDKFGAMVDSLLEEQKAPASASNAGEGGAEQSLTAVSASIVTEKQGHCKEEFSYV